MEPAEARRELAGSSYSGWRAQGSWSPLLVARGEGSRFFDVEGRSYLDFASQLVAANLGHSNAAVREAIVTQLAAIPYVQPSLATPIRAELQQQLRSVLPRSLTRYFFSTSGAEAV
ncbi:MAG TPA: aminotransferase class III-fold pyridoxal phosphate-dependent enzyme, partial [Thermoplasmata archaeon]|nr:aminotransferase class III-fold pyridoxal phosphate-dependent enzyme [Thermoplasmata archaeon]